MIYKLLYFIDFDFYEIYEEQLAGATYQKNRYGPTPIEYKKVIKRMIEKNEIEMSETSRYGYNQKRYIPLRKADLSIMKANEVQIIDRVLNRVSDMSARKISDYSHRDVPWLAAGDGSVIDYESVFYRTPEYSMRDYGDEEDGV